MTAHNHILLSLRSPDPGFLLTQGANDDGGPNAPATAAFASRMALLYDVDALPLRHAR